MIAYNILLIVMFGLYIVLAIVLVRKYLRTRDVGFIWLGVAGVVWPFLSYPLRLGERALVMRAVHHESVMYPVSEIGRDRTTDFTLGMSLNLLYYLFEVALLLVAAIYLARTKRST